MTDLGDLEKYVEHHPADHEQRWRLAKKLYKACEYERALKHLLIVQEGWHRKLNVLRYLAAAQYRLGRHDESIAALRRAIQYWPRDIGLREQLARMSEVAGRREDAANEWDAILDINPDHPLAEKAARRLRGEPGGSAEEELRLSDSDSGIGLILGWTCPSCGAQNNEEFERCWQCHGPAVSIGTPTPKSSRRPSPETESERNPWIATLLTGLVLVGFLGWGLTLFFAHLPMLKTGQAGALADGSIAGLVERSLFGARSLLALILLAAWPLTLKGCLILFRSRETPLVNVVITGLLLAIASYVVSYFPLRIMVYGPLLPILLSLVIIVATFRIGLGRSLGVWAAQLAVIAGLAALGLVSLVGLAPIQEAGVIARYAAFHDSQSPSALHDLGAVQTPGTLRFQWETTGSEWLDQRVCDVTFEIQSEPITPPLVVSLKAGNEPPSSFEAAPLPFRFSRRIKLGVVYELRVMGGSGHAARVIVSGILKPDVFS